MEQVSFRKAGTTRRALLLGLAALPPAAALAHPGVRAAVGRAVGPRIDLADFDLPPVAGLTRDGRAVAGFSSRDLGRPSVIHVWASWCPTCREEHPHLMRLAERGAAIFGVNVLDEPERARAYLETKGSPYRAVGQDPRGLMLRTFGFRGVPGSAVVRAGGGVAAQVGGPLDDASIRARILPHLA